MSGRELLRPRQSLPWRLGSSLVMGLTGTICRSFLYGLNNVQTEGLDSFLKVLDERRTGGRRHGLLTVSNHISVLDDPVLWGVLPLKYAFSPHNLRWGLGAHDICFKTKFASKFFSLGQVLPTHRLLHSPHGGLFQPTLAEAVHVISGEEPTPPSKTTGLTFTNKLGQVFPSPAAFEENRNAWVHVFPEACVHQHPDLALRYFKWGTSRLILESNPAPQFVPMFIAGFQQVMHEDRKKPRWLPRTGKDIRVIFGNAMNTDDVFGEQRQRWRRLVSEKGSSSTPYPVELEHDEEAAHLRAEVTEIVRDQVVRLRKTAGYPEDDPNFAKAQNWAREPAKKHFHSPVNGGLVYRE